MTHFPGFRVGYAVPRRRAPVAALAVTLFCLVTLLVTAVVAAAAHAADGLWLRPLSAEGVPLDRAAVAAPLVATQIQMDITGPLARTQVRQLFVNAQSEWVEGTYVFPLPEDAAVDSLRMVVDDKVIQGVVREKQQARETYEQAKRQGKRASLVTQERPNIFTTAVANIAPGGHVAIEIGLQEVLRWTDGHYELRFPAVMTPRYIPGQQEILGAAGSGWGKNTNQVPDAERITPPLILPQGQMMNPLSFTLHLDAGVPLEGISSPSHEIVVTPDEGGRLTVTLKDGTVPADRDFVLTWTPRAGDEPRMSLFRETGADGADYLLALVQPPRAEARRETLPPREVLFIIDTSGSMDGLSMDGAKAALRKALDGLGPRDRFNIIRFSNEASPLFDRPRPADPRHLKQARGFVESLSADGGTEILSALHLALDGRFDAGRVRQIILLTDGAVGNETEILRDVRRGLGDSRLFTIGIGSAPNSYLMRKAAELGHGTYTFIDNESQVEQGMTQLFAKLEAPVLSDLRATFSPAARAEAWPRQLPDLYAGEPLLLAVRVQDLAGGISLGGWLGGVDWSLTLPLAQAKPAPGIARLWARGKIEGLTDQRYEGRSEEEIRLDVLDVALTHQLVSAYTSLVAVDVTPARPLDQNVTHQAVPQLPPHGWNLNKLFGAPVSPNLPMQQEAAQDLFRAQGATAADLHMIAGLLALLLGGGLWLSGRRARRQSA
ncbi:marine proteobacterial sortase target protein [Magnetospira thiophila]